MTIFHIYMGMHGGGVGVVDPCDVEQSIDGFLCNYSTYEAVTLTDCDGNTTAVANASHAKLSSRSIDCSGGLFRIDDRVFRVHKTEESTTPPVTITDSSGTVWTVVGRSYNQNLGRWRYVARNIALSANLCHDITVISLSYPEGTCGEQLDKEQSSSTIKGKVHYSTYLRSRSDDRLNTQQSEWELWVDPADLPMTTDWAKLRFEAAAFPGRQFSPLSVTEPECGEPLRIMMEEVECQL